MTTRIEDAGSKDCLQVLPALLRLWAQELGFSGLRIAPATGDALQTATERLQRWLRLQRHGMMDYMAKRADCRADPALLLPDVKRVICVSLPYWPVARDSRQVLAEAETAYISRYALGRDYHKIMRARLSVLEKRLSGYLVSHCGGYGLPHRSRVFSDSAPVFEVEYARQSGLGWRGKHTLLLTRQGSWHFLGEIYTDLPLPVDPPVAGHCGTCRRCIEGCPTAAIVAPYEVDARRCISYLTIEYPGSIPVELRPLLGNRIYGCDDCQLLCPWNRRFCLGDHSFAPRHRLDAAQLIELFAWDEAAFLQRLVGSPIRRIGYQRWSRNIAVALGNACAALAPAKRSSHPVTIALRRRRYDASALVREHVEWALRYNALL